MSLRVRIALAMGLIAAAVSALSVLGAYAATRSQLQTQVDDFLTTRADDISRALAVGRDARRNPIGARDFDDIRPSPRLRELYDLDAVTQIIDADGNIVSRLDTEITLPVTDVDLTLAAGTGPQVLRTVEVDDGDRYRMITTNVAPGVAVQIARALEPNSAILRRLSARLVLLAGIGVASAAIAGWLFAKRTTEPIERLDQSARRVAETQQLDVPVAVGGDAEVASLATSFNTMLGALRSSRDQQHRLVMDASHELRTPLTSLRTGMELLERGDDLPDADRERLLTNLTAELTELGDLVSELVELASDRESSDEPAVDIALDAIARSVAERTRSRSGREVRVRSHDHTEVHVHPAMIERAVGNLVDNAVKYSPDGPIDIEIEGSTLTVADRGPGVADADKPHVFERFYRATEARSSAGSGLGLSIVADIAAHHDGSVGVTDRDGGGARFTLTLPTPPPR